jgi:hypothetical protein
VAGAISDCKAERGIPYTLTCRAPGVSESWFYKWRNQPVTAREVRRGKPADAIRQIFDESGGTYGSSKVWITLVRQGWRVSVNTVARLMAELGLAGRKIRRRRGLTRPGNRPAFPDFVRRDFSATAPDQVWAGDMTEIVTGEGKLYLATVIDNPSFPCNHGLHATRGGTPSSRTFSGSASRRARGLRVLARLLAVESGRGHKATFPQRGPGHCPSEPSPCGCHVQRRVPLERNRRVFPTRGEAPAHNWRRYFR